MILVNLADLILVFGIAIVGSFIIGMLIMALIIDKKV